MHRLKRTQAKKLLNETKKKLSQLQIEILQIEKLQKLAAPSGWKPNNETKPMISSIPSTSANQENPLPSKHTLGFQKQNMVTETSSSPSKTTRLEVDAPKKRQIFPLKSDMSKHFIEKEDVIEVKDQEESHKSKQLREKYGY